MLKLQLRVLASIAVLSSLTACMNPTVAVDDEIKLFKQKYPQQIKSFQSSAGPLGYAWSGDPNLRPLIFVHGSPGSWDGWSHFLLNTKLQKKFHVLAIDRPGYGQSSPGKTETSLEKQASQIMEILKTNTSHKPAILVGHSYGGPVVARAAMDFPGQVAGLIFVASSVSPDLEKTKWFQYPATRWPLRILIPTELRVCNEEILPLKAELTEMLPHWKEIKAKSALIQGEKDTLVPPANLDFLIEHLDAKTVIKVDRIPELNHFVPWLRPDLIVNAVLEVDDAI